MKCRICGSPMEHTVTELPFKVRPHSIVIVDGLPVWQCSACPEYVLEDSVMSRLEPLLHSVREDVSLTVVRYAA